MFRISLGRGVTLAAATVLVWLSVQADALPSSTFVSRAAPATQLNVYAGPRLSTKSSDGGNDLMEWHKPITPTEPLQKRGVTSWLDSTITGPLIDRARPALYAAIDATFNRTVATMTAALPSIIGGTVREILGFDPVHEGKPPKCFFQTACNYLFAPMQRISYVLRDCVGDIVTSNLRLQKNLITDLMVNTLKRALFLSRDSRDALDLRKRSLHVRGVLAGIENLYTNQINRVMQGLVAATRPFVRHAIDQVGNDTAVSIQGSLRSAINTVLPNSLQLGRTDQGGLLAPVREKLIQFEQAIIRTFTTALETFFGTLGDEVVKTTTKTMQNVIGDVVPFR